MQPKDLLSIYDNFLLIQIYKPAIFLVKGVFKMNVKRFQTFSRFIAIFLILIGVIQVLALFFVLTSSEWASHVNQSNQITNGFTFSIASRTISEFREVLTLKIILIITTAAEIFTLWMAQRLFLALANGATPFQTPFVKKLKTISRLIIVIDVGTPLLYSALITILAESGYQFQIGVTYWTIIGLIVYCAAEILNYGISLQELSDDTI